MLVLPPCCQFTCELEVRKSGGWRGQAEGRGLQPLHSRGLDTATVEVRGGYIVQPGQVSPGAGVYGGAGG